MKKHRLRLPTERARRSVNPKSMHAHLELITFPLFIDYGISHSPPHYPNCYIYVSRLVDYHNMLSGAKRLLDR